MLYTSRIKVSTNPLREKKRREKTNHTKIKNEPVSDIKQKNWSLGKIVSLKIKILKIQIRIEQFNLPLKTPRNSQ